MVARAESKVRASEFQFGLAVVAESRGGRRERKPLRVCDQLWCRFAEHHLLAHLLQSGSESLNLLLHLCDGRSLFNLTFSVLFEELIQQHRVHCFVAHGHGFSVLIANYQDRLPHRPSDRR